MAWFKKVRKPIEPLAKNQPSRVPEGLWVKCPSCGEVIYNKDLVTTLNVCPKCAHHFRIGAAERLRMTPDELVRQHTIVGHHFPPSMAITWPLIQPAYSEAKNSTP